jgi:hypothetical protein
MPIVTRSLILTIGMLLKMMKKFSNSPFSSFGMLLKTFLRNFWISPGNWHSATSVHILAISVSAA